ncbi:MAG: helix-turn-helix domain-containing protein [Ideonella sp. WA131b]|nr:helix-turn-helix domain-containing protein [Ideonella sp. WA131b]MCM0609315.1 helix-turn-helix domain-containing protein [Ideonella sp. WA131b]MCM0610278.1 helix-turn-helix domain-containing protein [Ideonella sp. WA131b]
MGSKYSHLSDAERWAIETKLKERQSLAAIGRTMGRHRSTICRERKRGCHTLRTSPSRCAPRACSPVRIASSVP